MTALIEKISEYLFQIDQGMIDHWMIESIELSELTSKVVMTVQPNMINGQGYCHGGQIFALADHTFAYAAMTVNRFGVTLTANITYANPAREKDVLTAIGTINPTTGRVGNGSVTITNQDDLLIATLQAVFYYKKNQIIGGDK